MKKILATILVLTALNLTAHEGHNIAPGSYKSLHGGVVQNGVELNLEVIVTGKDILVYPISHESKDVPAKDITVTAMAKPKKGKAYPVTLSNINGGYGATVDLQGANRLPIEVTVKSKNKTDKFTVQVEE